MSKSIKDSIMKYFELDLVPRNLLKEIEAIMSEQMIGEDDEQSLRELSREIAYEDARDLFEINTARNVLRAEQRQALRKALYGKEASDA